MGAGEAGAGDDVLAGVVAFGGAGPEEEAAVEGWGLCYFLVWGSRGERRVCLRKVHGWEDVRMEVRSLFF